MKGYIVVGFAVLSIAFITLVILPCMKNPLNYYGGMVGCIVLFCCAGFYFGSAIDKALVQILKEIKK